MADGEELWWDTHVADHADAKSLLEAFFQLPGHLADINATVEALILEKRLIAR